MITFYARSLVGLTLLSLSMASGWFAALGLTLPHVTPAADQMFYAEPGSGVFHANDHCPLIHRPENLARLPGLSAAQRYGVRCAHCTSDPASLPLRIASPEPQQ